MYKEVNVNMSLETILGNMDQENAVDCIKLLHCVYGISKKKIAEVMGISPSNLCLALKYGSFYLIVSNSRLDTGINSLRTFYLDKFFV